MLIGVLFAPLHEGSNRGRGGVKVSHRMASANVPESIFRWSIRRAFVHEGRNSVRHDAVDASGFEGVPEPRACGEALLALKSVAKPGEAVTP